MALEVPCMDPFEKEFFNYVSTSAKAKSVAVLGVAYFGRMINSILQDTEVGKVYVVDRLKDKLSLVKDNLREQDIPRCLLIPSNALDLNFSAGQFRAIKASGWLSRIPQDQVFKFIQQCYEWLEPDGQIFISTSCRHGSHIGLNLMDKVDSADHSNGDVSMGSSDEAKDFRRSEFLDLNGGENSHDVVTNGAGKADQHTDVNDLTAELLKAGFTLENCGHVAGDLHPEHWQHFGQLHVVAVGRKLPKDGKLVMQL